MKRYIWAIALLTIVFIFPKPAFATSSCDELTVVSGNNRFVPSTVSFSARATDTSGPIQAYRFYFGDGTQTDTTTPTVSHVYNVSGTFTSRVDVKNSQGMWTSGAGCQNIFSLLQSPLESQKSGCSNVFIVGTNYAPVGSDVKFLVTGYDNKSGLKGYKIDFGNGQIKQNNVGSFDLTFPSPGTFTVKGYVTDSKGVEKGGTDSCQVPLYITGQPLVSQPATGTPTWFTVAGILSGIWLLFIVQNRLSHR